MGKKTKRGSGGRPAADPAAQQRLLQPSPDPHPGLHPGPHPGPPKVPPPAQPVAFYNEYYGPPLGPPVDANGIVVGQWATGLCACWDHCVPNCLMAALLPFVALAQITSRMGIARFGDAISFFLGLSVIIAVCGVANDVIAVDEIGAMLDDEGNADVDWLLNGTDGAQNKPTVGELVLVYVLQVLQSTASVVLFLATWQLRANVRERFRIPGGCVDDCCSVFWLSCCVIAQMATHIKSYRPGTCDFGPVDTLPAYDYGGKKKAAGGKGDDFASDAADTADAKEPSGAYQRYGAETDEKEEDEDEDEEMKSRMRAVDAPNMRYM
jgi:Cys-rich protein (TIGR01571 family)